MLNAYLHQNWGGGGTASPGAKTMGAGGEKASIVGATDGGGRRDACVCLCGVGRAEMTAREKE